MPNTEQMREDLHKVASLVLTARRLLAGGTLMDLSAIQDRVREVCTTVETMPKEDGRGLLVDMQALIGKLDSLEEDLHDQLSQLKQRLGD
ncbi:MAG TPA: hypothetical protein HPP80_10660 [Rhodospirillaceae bacterium]|nr:hypothetical protein [Rhodospirillaceae bacterium]